MSTPSNTPQNLVFEFGTLGKIECTPSFSEKGNWFFAGEPSVDGNRVRLDLGAGDPFAVLNALPTVTVNGVSLSAKNAAHISKPGKNGRGGGNPTITQSGSISIDEIKDGATSFVLQATITFLAATDKLPAGYVISCKAIPMAEQKVRPARGSHVGFTVANA